VISPRVIAGPVQVVGVSIGVSAGGGVGVSVGAHPSRLPRTTIRVRIPKSLFIFRSLQLLTPDTVPDIPKLDGAPRQAGTANAHGALFLEDIYIVY
jgi:hypothetical protein